MRVRKLLLLTFLSLGLTPAWSEPALEPPQIWCVEGVSLSMTRAEIEQRAGKPAWDRPLKASLYGERWEYNYRGGLRAAFPDRDPGDFPTLLVGARFTSRGVEFRAGLTPEQLGEQLGEPSSKDGQAWLYDDPDRHARLRVWFEQGRVAEYCILRPRR